MRNVLCLAWIFSAAPLFAAHHVIDQKTFDAIAAEMSGERAQELDRRIVEYHRIQGSPMMEGVAREVVLPALQAMHVEAAIEQFPSDGKTTYQTYVSPIGWTMRGGELSIEGETPERLCRYSDIPMCVSTYSKGGDWSGELVDVGVGTNDDDYKSHDVRGKVALASGYARDVARKAVLKYGALGVVIYPAADDRPDHPDMVRYNGLWTRAEDVAKTSGGFQISANQYAHLKALMAKGPVRVHGTIDADLGPHQLTLVHAWIRGSEPDEVVITAHLDHPKWSANDNASGSAELIEMARTLQTLMARGTLSKPRNTIHFIWVPEYFGTIAYLDKHPEARACSQFDDPRAATAAKHCIVANINMDMVGEDTVKTNGRFYMTRAPLSVPSFLDALLPDVLEQTREANLFAPSGTRNYWPAEMTGYYQGSDHDLFLGIGVPSTMFGHDPDWTHHTSEDTPDKTDASELRRVGTLATSAAYWIASATDAQWSALQPAIDAEKSRRQNAMAVDMKRAGYRPPTTDNRKPTTIYHRLTIPPIFSEQLFGTDLTKENDLALYETINLLDGKRGSAEIANLLTLELGDMKYDTVWVDRVLAQLASMKFVAK
jgi:aminopeptidase YwaD